MVHYSDRTVSHVAGFALENHSSVRHSAAVTGVVGIVRAWAVNQLIQLNWKGPEGWFMLYLVDIYCKDVSLLYFERPSVPAYQETDGLSG